MQFDSLLLVCALLCGAAWREIYTIGWRSYRSFTHPDCASIYNGYPEATIFSLSELQKHGPLPGLAHLSIATSKHHGMRNAEVWMQTLAKGKATPIHSHAHCEEVNIVLSGTGEVRTRVTDGSVVTTPFPTNTTSVAPARVVYQMANVGKGDLQLLVVMGCSYPTITMYSDWNDTEGKLVKPMFWDNVCPTTLPPAVARLMTKQTKHADKPTEEL